MMSLADLNAGTSFDETIYNLTVPTDTARLVDTGVEVLAEWAHEQLFDSTEVVNERGVVREEWRLGRGAGQRMSDKEIPIILKGSKYFLIIVSISAGSKSPTATTAIKSGRYHFW